jgi:hypothetical protein
MTDKQRRFADEYLLDLNATRAYKAAYPSVRRDETAATAGGRLLRNVHVQNYVQERMKDRQTRTEINQDMVLREIAAIAFETDSEAVSVKDKLRALELLGKHLGLFDPRKDQLDREEQAARIAKLRAETKTEDERRELVVRFEDFPDEVVV